MTNESVPRAIRSMTGFARVHKSISGGEIVFTIKTLNHRGLDVHFHTPPEIDIFEGALRAAIKRLVMRGHADVRVTIARLQEEETAGLNEPLLRAYIGAFRKAAGEYQIAGAVPDLNMAFRLPGMLKTAGDPEPRAEAELEAALLEAAEEALAILNGFREREGAELAGWIRQHNASIAQTCSTVEEIRGRAMPLFQQRLSERLKDLLRGANVDAQRLAQETALLADRSDIGEEVARLKIHSKELDDILDAGGEAGKKIDFLLQEMNREANTILSKTTGIGELGLKITGLALAAKADIEKIREQALNIE